MNLQEANKFRDKMRALQIEQEKLIARVIELEALALVAAERIAALETPQPTRRERRARI